MTTTPALHPAAPVPGPAPGALRPGPSILLRTWAWGWLAIAQFLSGLLLSAPYLMIVVLLVTGISCIPAFGVGIPITAAALLAAMGMAAFERFRVEAFAGVHVVRPAPPPNVGQPAWRRHLLDARPWRACAHLALSALWSLLIGTVTLVLTSVAVALATLPLYDEKLPQHRLAMPFGPGLPASWPMVVAGWAGLVVVPLVARGLITVDVALARWLLGPSRSEQVVELSQRVQTLTLTREATVDSVELERRRIERDLHDGPQQRLVAIAMDLGMARAKLDRSPQHIQDPQGVRELLDRAHAAAKEAIVEMRQVARGIHPPVLTDRGLDAALSALAARSPVPVSVRVDVTPRPSATVEAIAYFCVSEALTNVAKHSRARSARVEVTRADGGLLVTVTDDGVGGADPTRGTGLVGLRDRVAAVDGTLAVSSPAGGPTVLSVRLPERRNPYSAPTGPRQTGSHHCGTHRPDTPLPSTHHPGTHQSGIPQAGTGVPGPATPSDPSDPRSMS
ncbi:MAG TPA: sensor histidine kinase [Kineosporiaceae bacterium]|nr:sensor histidine kinase [Kineosporiaceae bacterium]